jgi:restriction system protein
MAIPDFQTIMLPLLNFSGDSKEHSIREAVDFLATEFKLSNGELRELLPSGQQETFANRVNWVSPVTSKCTTRGRIKVYHPGALDF